MEYLENIILGVVANAFTSVLAYSVSYGHSVIVGEGFLEEIKQRKTSLATLSKSTMENLSEEIDWESPEVILFLKSPEVESVVRQIYATKMSSDSEDHSTISKIQDEFTMLLNLHLGWPQERQSNTSTIIFDAILNESEKLLDIAIDKGILSAHEAKASFRYYRIMEEITALSKNIEFLRDEKHETVNDILGYEKKYREQIAYHFRHITPPDLDSQRKWPIDKLYVSPNFKHVVEEELKKREVELTPAEFINHIFRTVLLGDPGSGKSTFTMKLAHDLSSQYSKRLFAGRQVTPIHIILREYGALKKTQSCSIHQFIELTAVSKHQLQEPPEGSVEYLLRNGRAIVIFDGLDELLDTRYRQEISSDIESFCKLYPAVPVIITSRKVGYKQAPLDPYQFKVYYLDTFDENQTQTYVEKWFKLDANLTGAQREEKISSFMQESETVPDLRANPLLLALMCNIYRGEGYIPKNRPDVYEKCATMLFERWDKSRGIYPLLPFEAHVRPAMMHIAHWIYIDEGRQSGVTEDHLIDPTAEYLQKNQFEDQDEAVYAARSFITFCRGRAWVFTDTGTTKQGSRIYQFTHRTFLEYFTAAYIVRVYRTPEDLVEYLIPRIKSREWDVVSQLAFQLQNKRFEEAGDELLNLLLDDVSMSKQGSNVLDFAGRCLEFMVPSPRVRRAITNRTITELVNWGTKLEIEVSKSVSPESRKFNEIFSINLMKNITRVATENRDVVSRTVVETFNKLTSSSDENIVLVALELGITFADHFLVGIDARYDDVSNRFWEDVSREIYQNNLELVRRLIPKRHLLGILSFQRNDTTVEEFVSHFGTDSIFKQGGSPLLPMIYFSPIEFAVSQTYQWFGGDDRPIPFQALEDLGNVLIELETPWKSILQLYRGDSISRPLPEIRELSPDALFCLFLVEATELEKLEKSEHGMQQIESIFERYASEFDLFLPSLFARFIPTEHNEIDQHLAQLGFCDKQKLFIWNWIDGDSLIGTDKILAS